MKCVDKFLWPPEVAEFKALCKELSGSGLVPWSGEVLKFTKPKNNKYSDGDVKCLIDTGAEVCKAIKRCYPELNWTQVAYKFTKLKNVCRVYHPGLQDIPLIRELMNYKDQDIKDALSIERIA